MIVAAPSMAAPRLSVVVPAYNEAEVLAAFHTRLSEALASEPAHQVVYVDDGSSDDTWSQLEALARSDARVVALRLSRNFGKEAALTAGLDHATGSDWIAVIDADLQDPPELIPQLLEKARQGFDVVYAKRRRRDGETWLKKLTSAGFYRAMDLLSGTAIPRDTGDFRVMSRRAVDALGSVRERQRFMKGLFAWVGFAQAEFVYDRDARHAGTTKWNYWRLTNLAVEGITSFSSAPLRIASWLGLGSAAFAFGYGMWVVVKALVWGEPVRGYPTLMVVILFLGGAQLIALGVVGEYIGRTYNETKQRPLYFVSDSLNQRM